MHTFDTNEALSIFYVWMLWFHFLGLNVWVKATHVTEDAEEKMKDLG